MPYRILVCCLMLCLSGCDTSGETNDPKKGTTQTCTPGESFAADDGCNTCVCGDDGNKETAACTTLGCVFDPCAGKTCGEACSECDPSEPTCTETAVEKACNMDGQCTVDTGDLCETDLCTEVSCTVVEPSCEGSMAYSGYADQCDPDTGKCITPPVAPPQDCAEQGQECVNGDCVDGACAPMDAAGEGDCAMVLGVVFTGKSCEMISGCTCIGNDCENLFGELSACEAAYSDCLETPYEPCANKTCGEGCTECAPDDPDCVETDVVKACNEAGACVADTGDLCGKDLCAEVDCPNSAPFCEDNIAYGGVYSECNPATGECLIAPGMPPQDCTEEGLTCEKGQCVEGKGDCAALDAVGVGSCDAYFGVTWNGSECVGVSGCDCEGADCDKLYQEVEACQKAHAECAGSYEPCAEKKCGAICTICDPTDKDCLETAVLKFCDAQGVCGSTEPLCADAMKTESCNNQGAPANDAFELMSATVEGDTLHLGVAYSGGCGEHFFSACYEELIAAGIDVIHLNVSHDANGDFCEAYLSEQLTIDLLPLQSYYKQATQAEEGVIKLVVNDGEQGLMYAF